MQNPHFEVIGKFTNINNSAAKTHAEAVRSKIFEAVAAICGER